jgi:cell wall assembly regulator SMI1
MQKFTRALTREIEVGGERLAITLDEAGLSLRPVGSRKPAHELSWAAVVCALAASPSGAAPAEAELLEAIETLRGGAAGAKAADPPAAPESEGVAELLARLDAWLKKNRKRYHKGLLPGADDKALAKLEKALGRAVPEGLAALLRWHNGQEEDMIGAFVESFNLMSADEIAAAYQERKGEKGWDAAFVPILDDYQGDHVVLDARKPELPVREVWDGRDDHPEVATSMRGWLAMLLADFQAGKYHEDPERGEFMRGDG